jgi:D-alanyl-D-alanine carboxypeptidase (penicillin-binding protein 5/6)
VSFSCASVRAVAATELLESRHRASRRPRWGAICTALLVLLVALALWRMSTEVTPPLQIQRTLAAYVRLSGSAPVLSWPREGQAAVEVEGVGRFGTSGPSTPAPIASVAKVMTAYLTLLEHPLAAGQAGFVMTVTRAEVQEEEQRVALGESTVPVRAGERLSERQALQALLLPSANNVAALLAVHDAGTIPAFVARMNATARSLGMHTTAYTDPSGFDPSTVSTAADQLKLAAAAMREPAFAAIVAEPFAKLPVAGRVANYNGLVGEDGYVGIKTGSDRAAGGCLMFAKRVRIAGRHLLVLGVVLGQREGALIEAALASARALGDSAARALRVQTALPGGASVLTATSADGARTHIVTTAALRQIGWAGLTFPVRVRVRGTMTKLRAGQRLAWVRIGADGRAASGAETAAVASHTLGEPSLSWRLGHLL